jgi:hypothetical protein
MTTIKSKIKSKPTVERIIKTIVNNSNVHLLDINKKIRTNNLHLQRILENNHLAPDVRKTLSEIFAKNLIIINSNRTFASTKVISVKKNEDDGN